MSKPVVLRALSSGKDGDPVKRHTPAHLAAPPRHTAPDARRGLLPRVLAGAACLCIAGSLFLSGIFVRFSGQEAYATPETDAPAEAAMTEEMEEALARSQAELLARAATEAVPPTLEELDWVTVDLIPVNEFSRPGDAVEEVNAIVVHYTGNPGTTAEQHRSYFAGLAETGEASVSSHFVIGMDGAIVQCVPLDEVSYCSNHRNSDTISIECCHPDTTGQFTGETEDALVRLLQYLTDAYGLDEDGVIRHYEVTGKLCPLYYVEHPDAWEAIKARVFED